MLATKGKTEPKSPRQSPFLESSGLQIYTFNQGRAQKAAREERERTKETFKLENNPGREEQGLASVVGHKLRLGEGTRFHLQQHTYTLPPQKKAGPEEKTIPQMTDSCRGQYPDGVEHLKCLPENQHSESVSTP